MGAGLGGFADGILLHQIAQWHNMGSAMVPPVTMEGMSLNMRWDGLFHAAVWFITVIGLFAFRSEAVRGGAPASVAALTGQLVLGWGLFNLLEGIVDHHLLGIHHVRDLPAHVPIYDWVFLGVAGLGFIALGALLQLKARRVVPV